MKIYNLNKPQKGEWKNFNLLPYISFYYDDIRCYLNTGWLFICVQFKIKPRNKNWIAEAINEKLEQEPKPDNIISANSQCGKCEKCGESFDIFRDSCGLGQSWYLYRCHKCKQLHAGAYEHGFIPKEVLNDKEIISLPR